MYAIRGATYSQCENIYLVQGFIRKSSLVFPKYKCESLTSFDS